MVKAYVSYVDDGKVVSGMFDLIEEKESYIRIASGKNEITIPYHKINKIKKKK